MKNRPEHWTRRQFVGTLGTAAASSLLARNASAVVAPHGKHFAFLGFAAGTVHVCSDSGFGLTDLHVVQAASPAHLAMHPAHSVLYVVHEVDQWEHRRRGAVSAWRFDAARARLSLLGTQPLSLSATSPRHAALTSGGDALLVAASGGGIYNVLPIAPDGSLQPVSAIRKELGMEHGGRAKIATPQRVVLHGDGSIYAYDPGQETVSQFTVRPDTIALLRRSRLDVATGACDLVMPAARDGAPACLRPADARCMLLHTARS